MGKNFTTMIAIPGNARTRGRGKRGAGEAGHAEAARRNPEEGEIEVERSDSIDQHPERRDPLRASSLGSLQIQAMLEGSAWEHSQFI